VDAITVIMPTRALPERAVLLRRAIDSVLQQQGVHVAPLLVINGPSADPAIVRELDADPRLRVTRLEQASLPAALHHGRGLVDTAWFAELDDDDVLLPDALAARLAALQANPPSDVVITTGYRRTAHGDEVNVHDTTAIRRDPLLALCGANWLLPGSWLCRTSPASERLFEHMPPYLECTWLAIQFAMHHTVHFLEQPTVIWHVDSPRAVSRSRDYVLGQVPALERILGLDLPPAVHAAFRRQISPACHEIADLRLREGNRRDALAWHLRSLREPGGLRWLPFTRRLLLHGSLQPQS
jgi:hypothetical protein